MKKHENHFCANNDVECICKCYSDGFKQGKKEVIEEIKKIITDEFYKLEEIEKDFKINQEIIRTRNKIIKLLK